MGLRNFYTTLFFVTTWSSFVYSQLELSFTSKYKANYFQLDSVITENINTGSRTVNYYPDTILHLIVTGIDRMPDPELLKISLSQNYPNPFDGKTDFKVCLSEDEKLTISIYNVLGKLILNWDRQMQPGNHSFTFTGGEEEICFLVAGIPGYSSAIKMINSGGRKGDDGVTLEYNGCSPNNETILKPVNKKGYSSLNRNDFDTDRGSAHVHPGNLKSGFNEFLYNPGDSLRLTGFITDDSGRIITDTISDRPVLNKTITFQFGKEHRIIIILYHDITDSMPDDEYERNSIDFENDMKYIMANNYRVLSINDLLLLKTGDLKLYSDGIIITFDDGYASNFSKAFPFFSSYDIPATFFIVPEWIGDPNYMTWPEVWQLSQYQNANGTMPFTIASHTSSHPYLEKSEQYFSAHQDYLRFLFTQLEDSRKWIVDVTGQQNIFLSLPYGDGANNNDIIHTAMYCGYSGIRTSAYSSFTINEMDLFSLPGISILSDDPIRMIDEFLNVW